MLLSQGYHKTELQTQGDKHRIEEQAMRENIRLIHRLVNHYRGVVDEYTLQDLQQTACMAFILELRKFDHIINDDFRRSVIVRVRGALIDELRSRDYLSRDKRSLINKIRKAESHLMAQLGRGAKASEICTYLEITVQEYNDAVQDGSLFDDVELQDIAADIDDEDKEQWAFELESQLNKLPEDIKKVMYLMFVMGLSTQETALTLEISDIKVHRLKCKGVEILKKNLR